MDPDALVSLLPPGLAERYSDAELLGEGAFGRVILATDSRRGRQVAIKVLKALEEGAGAWEARFEREAKLTIELNSPHVVRAFKSGKAGGVPYLVLEYVEGCDLETLVEESGGRLSLPLALRIFVQVLQGLRDAHGAGVLHRDLKPENVLMRHRREAVLTDFGLARDVGGETLTATGTVMGTMAYMAPEIFRGEPASAKSDIYAAALLFGFMVTGEIPMDGDTAVRIYERREEGGFRGFRAEGVPLPVNIDTMLIRALDPVAANRPVSAWDLAEQLSREIVLSSALAEALAPDPGAAPAGDLVDLASTRTLAKPDAETRVDLEAPATRPAATRNFGEAAKPSSHRTNTLDPEAPLLPAGASPRRRLGMAGLFFGMVMLGAFWGEATGRGTAGGRSDLADKAFVAEAEAEAKAEAAHRLAAGEVQEYLLDREQDPTLTAFLEFNPPSRFPGLKAHIQELWAEAQNRLLSTYEERVDDFRGFDISRASLAEVDAVGRLAMFSQLVHVTKPITSAGQGVLDRGAPLEDPWQDQIDKIMVTWQAGKLGDPDAQGRCKEQDSGTPGRTWQSHFQLEFHHPRRLELAQRLRSPNPASTAKSYEVRARTVGDSIFAFAGNGHSIVAMMSDEARKTMGARRFEEFWSTLEIPLKAPPSDLILLLDFSDFTFTFVGEIQLIGAGETLVRLPVRPAYSAPQRSDRAKQGMVRVPTGVRLRASAVPPGLHTLRFVVRSIRALADVRGQGRVRDILTLATGDLPPEAALPEEGSP